MSRRCIGSPTLLASCPPSQSSPQATLTLLLDHLRLVSSFHAHNRMTPQNLAVCFGPVLLPARQAPARSRIRGSGPSVTSAVDFKRHIEVLHYLLQSWPGEPAHALRCQSRQAAMKGPSPDGQSEPGTYGRPRLLNWQRLPSPTSSGPANEILSPFKALPLQKPIRGLVAAAVHDIT